MLYITIMTKTRQIIANSHAAINKHDHDIQDR